MYSVSIHSLKLVEMKNKDLVKQLNSTAKVIRFKTSGQSILYYFGQYIYSQDYIYLCIKI